MSEMNIYQRMSAATNEIGTIAKNLKVGTGNYSYKAVAESDVLAAVKRVEQKHGIYSYPVDRSVIESKTIEAPKIFEDKSKNTITTETKVSHFIRVEVTYRFVNMDKPDEWIEGKAYGDGVDANDKAPGKAVTYADKYALLKFYKIETGEDADAHASDDLAGHDAMKILERMQRAMTTKMAKGLTEDEIIKAMGLSKSQWQTLWKMPVQLKQYENKLMGL